jgi:predicted permease
MPADFRFVDPDVRLWVPAAFSAEQKTARHSNNFHHIGRLAPGASLQQVQSQVDALNRANLERFPEWREVLINAGFHTAAEPLQEMLVGEVRKMLYLLWAGAAFVLLIGVLNLVNLSLARLNLRAKEIATRIALGAGQWQVARQFLVESLLVSLSGGVLGLVIASGMLQAIEWIGIEQLPRAMAVDLDWLAVLYGLLISAFVGVAMGLFPLFRLFHSDLAATLRSESRGGTTGPAARAVRRGLVVAQVAFGFLLLAGAGLLTASFRQLLSVDPGFRGEGVSTASLRLPSVRYSGEQPLRDFQRRLLEALRAQPGIVSAGATNVIPLGGNTNDSVIVPEGYVGRAGESLVSPFQMSVSTGYFETMGIRLIRGRYFDARDHESATAVAIVDERLARKFWPDADPVGKRFFQPSNAKNLTRPDADSRFYVVVGVVADVRITDVGRPTPVGAYYFPAAQAPTSSMTVVARASSGSAVDAIRRTVASLDPELAIFDVRTMQERTMLSLSSRRAAMLLATSFGAVALFLTAIGVYGVLAYLVSTRIREIGIRLALGAPLKNIFWIVLREGLVLVGVGVLLGVGGAIAMRRALESQIYGVSSLDPLVLSSAVTLLALVALLASSLPANRAMRIDPVRTLSEQ